MNGRPYRGAVLCNNPTFKVRRVSLRRGPDFEQFLKVLWRRGRPSHLPFYEHIASPGFISRRMGVPFDRMSPDDPAYWRTYVDFWLGMGYDCVPMEIPLNCPLPSTGGGLSHGSEAQVVIRNMQDFEAYPWPDESNPIEFRHFETVAELLPDGAKIVGGVCAGPYEWVSWMMGTIGISYALADNPELVRLVFKKVGSLHYSTVRQLATMDAIGALRQGDDLGFKTSTFLRPDDLRKYVFPIYKRMVDEAHGAGKPFILHSCGNLAEVYEDLIEGCGIDAKHSFEDVIQPVSEFKRQYGDRVTPLGGLDVDVICRSTEEELRAYARRMIEDCFYDGYWALGTGNSLTDYMPVESYLAVLDEGMKVAG
jgi:uroporphyrinogen decarboxylase